MVFEQLVINSFIKDRTDIFLCSVWSLMVCFIWFQHFFLLFLNDCDSSGRAVVCELQGQWFDYHFFLAECQGVLHYHDALTLHSPNSLCFCVAELGDYSETEHSSGYLSDYCFIPNPPQDFHKEVAKHHQQHRYPEIQHTH